VWPKVSRHFAVITLYISNSHKENSCKLNEKSAKSPGSCHYFDIL